MDITRKDIDTLKGLNWLNDEIINFYLQMIVERSKGGGSMRRFCGSKTLLWLLNLPVDLGFVDFYRAWH